MKYKMVNGSYSESFNEEVQNFINEGWTPLGQANCSIGGSGNRKMYIQTLVKYDENELTEMKLRIMGL